MNVDEYDEPDELRFPERDELMNKVSVDELSSVRVDELMNEMNRWIVEIFASSSSIYFIIKVFVN